MLSCDVDLGCCYFHLQTVGKGRPEVRNNISGCRLLESELSFCVLLLYNSGVYKLLVCFNNVFFVIFTVFSIIEKWVLTIYIKYTHFIEFSLKRPKMRKKETIQSNVDHSFFGLSPNLAIMCFKRGMIFVPIWGLFFAV